MTEPASWLCGACGAVKAPPPRPGGIRGLLGDLYQIRSFVIFAVFLIAVVIAMAAAGWGQYFVREPFWGRKLQSPKHALAVIALLGANH
jgi:hypothetical protein